MRMNRTRVAFVFLLAAAASLRADVVTLPAAASIQGGNPFFSDVRVFNTSYASSVDVTATYRCFIATSSCPTLAPRIDFTLAPRESRSFNDIVAVAFGSPDTAGGVEFEFSGPEDQIVVTSRLFSTSPLNSVGMFIPGLDEVRSYAVSVLTSIRHDPLNGVVPGFRANVGVFNPGGFPTQVTFTIFNGGAQVGSAVVRSVPLHSGVQVSGIFEAAGLADLSTSNATIVVTASAPVFSYAAVLDNRTADPIFVIGAPDQSTNVTPTPTLPGPTATRTPTPSGMTATPTRTPTPGDPTSTQTPTTTLTPPGPTTTPTPTQPGPTATATPTTPFTPSNTPTITPTRTSTRTATPTFTPNGNHIVTVGTGGLHVFTDSTSGTNQTTIPVGTTVEWDWASGTHSTTSDTGVWDSFPHSTPNTFSFQFNMTGTFPYHCTVHGVTMNGTVHVN